MKKENLPTGDMKPTRQEKFTNSNRNSRRKSPSGIRLSAEFSFSLFSVALELFPVRPFYPLSAITQGDIPTQGTIFQGRTLHDHPETESVQIGPVS